MLLLSFVLPETLLAVALLLVVTNLALPFTLGTTSQVIGWSPSSCPIRPSWCARGWRPSGRSWRRPAMDLGASPLSAQRRVILPMLVPAIVASAVLVFADVIDDFVIVRYLSGDASTEPTSVKIYNTARAAPTPALNALATLMLVAAMLAVAPGS
jgi:spermidine/putrescine transport system permease protein